MVVRAVTAALLTYALGLGAGSLIGLTSGGAPALARSIIEPRLAAPASIYSSHNALLALLLVAGGASFGILTGILLFTNGLSLGVTAVVLARHQGTVILLGLLPHGVFELPALILAGTTGLLIGQGLYAWCRRDPVTGETIAGACWRLGSLALALLVFASLLEAFLSPLLLLQLQSGRRI
jgi:stage II sporulation protein M